MYDFTKGEDGEYLLNAVAIPDTDNIGLDITFTVASQMAIKIKKNYMKAQRKIIKIDGFRKGKAPTGLIEKKMGGLQAVYGATFITYANVKIVEMSPHKIIHTYDMDAEEQDNKSWVVTFKAAIEPPANIKAEDLKMAFDIPKLDPEDYVNYRIATFSRVNPYLHIKEDDAGDILSAEEDDMVEISVIASLDDELFEHGSHESTNIRLVEGGVNPQSLYEKLLGSVPGDNFSIITTKPEEIPGPFRQDFEGKSKFEIKVTVNYVYRCEDPKIDDDLAITAGYDSLEEWKKSLFDSADRINKSREEQTKKTLVLEHITSTIKYPDFPDAWAEAHAKELIARGKHQDTPFLRQELKKIAKQNTLLKQIGEFLSIEWDEEEQEKPTHERDEQGYAEKVLLHLIDEKVEFTYVDPGTEGNNTKNRSDGTIRQVSEGSPSSTGKTLAPKLQTEV